MEEPVSVAGVLDHLPAHLIDFPPAGKLAGRNAGSDERERGVARVPDDGEHLALFRRGILPHVTGPGDVGIDAPGRRLLGPQVNQDEVAPRDSGGSLRGRTVVRIGAMGVDGGNRRRGRREAVRGDAREDELLEAVLRQRLPFGDHGGGMREGFVHDAAELRGGVFVRGQLAIVPDRFEALDEVGGRRHLDAVTADQVDRARVHAGNIRDGVHRRILHGDPFHALHDAFEIGPLLVPGNVQQGVAGQFAEDMGLDTVEQFDRCSLRGNPVVPAAGDVSGRIEAEHAVRQGIAAAEIIEEPAVQAGSLAESLLDLGEALVRSR